MWKAHCGCCVRRQNEINIRGINPVLWKIKEIKRHTKGDGIRNDFVQKPVFNLGPWKNARPMYELVQTRKTEMNLHRAQVIQEFLAPIS